MEKKLDGVGVKVLVAVTFVAMVLINALSAMLPINGITPGEVSDSYPNLFAPTGITFSIWGLIYALLALYTLYHLGLFRGSGQESNAALLRKVGIVFIISSVINAAWIFTWHYRIIPLSMILMAFLLVCLIKITLIINAQPLTIREKIFIRLPFSIYFGWITVATIANAAALLVSLGWDGFGISEAVWTIIMLAAGVLIGGATAIRFKDIAYGLVLIWAYTGILIKHLQETGHAGGFPEVITAVIICIALFFAALVYVLFSLKPKPNVSR